MKNRFLIPLVPVLMLALYSCVGSPESTEQGAVHQQVVLQEKESESFKNQTSVDVSPQMRWVPETKISMYVDGTVDKKTSYSYDNTGRPLAEIETDSRDELILKRLWTYTDNTNMNPERIELLDRTGIVSTTRYIFDSRGRIIKETIQNAAGKTTSELFFNYRNDVLQSTEARDSSGLPQLILEYSYQDGIATLIEYKQIDGSLEARFERDIERDRSGAWRILEERTVAPDGSVESAVKFDFEGDKKISGTYFIGTTKTKVVNYEYDENNVTRETWLNANGRPFEVIERSWIAFPEVEE